MIRVITTAAATIIFGTQLTMVLFVSPFISFFFILDDDSFNSIHSDDVRFKIYNIILTIQNTIQ